MEKDIIIKIRTSSEDSVSGLEKVSKELQGVDKSADAADKKLGSLKSQIKQLKEEALKAGATSPIGQKALKDAADLQGKLDQVNELVKRNNTDFDKFREVTGIAKGAINSYAAFQSVMALTGVENEKLLQTMVKLQAAQQLLNSIEAARASLLQKNEIVTKGMAAVQSAYGMAVGTSTGALKLFRLALISTGIGALVVAVGMLVANWDAFVGWVKKSVNELRKYKEALAFILPIVYLLIKAYDLVTEQLQKMGLIDSEETKRIIDNAEKRVEAIESERKIIGEKYDYEIAKAQAAGKNTFELEQQKRAAVIESIKAQMEATIQLVRLTGEFTDDQKEAMLELKDLAIKTQREMVVATISEEKKKTDEYKKVLNERAKANESNASKIKKEQDEKYKEELEREDAQWQLLQETRLSKQELELLQLAQGYDEKFKLAQGNAELEKALAVKQGEEMAEIKKRFEDEKLAAEWEQAQIMRELRLEIKALNEGELDENASAEEVQAFYDIKRELANEEFEARMEDLRMQLETKAITDEEFLLRKQAAEKTNENNITGIKKANADAQIEIEKRKTDATAQNLSTVANLMSQFSELAGKESATGKAMAIGAATINTFQSATAAYAAGSSLPGPVGLIMGPVAAGLAIAAGIANVKKIIAVKTPKGGGGGGGGISIPNMPKPTIPSNQPTGQNNEVQQGTFTDGLLNVNGQQGQVVVLESDIALARNRNQQSVNISEL